MNEEKKAFLAVGAGAYAPGLGALARFRQEIYSGSKRSMTRNLGRLNTTTGLDLRADKNRAVCVSRRSSRPKLRVIDRFEPL